MSLQIGDMVLLVKVGALPVDSAFTSYIKPGLIGQVIGNCCGKIHSWTGPCFRCDFKVHLAIEWLCVPESFLRRIEPPEAADKDFHWEDLCQPVSKHLEVFEYFVMEN